MIQTLVYTLNVLCLIISVLFFVGCKNSIANEGLGRKNKYNDCSMVCDNSKCSDLTSKPLKKKLRVTKSDDSRGFALVIGVNNYNNKLQNLTNPVNEARHMENTLFANDYNTVPLIDSEATKENIINCLECFSCKVRDDDTFLFYFSGHGNTYENKADFAIMPYQQKQSEIIESISNMELVSSFSKIKASNKVMIIDACYATHIDNYPYDPVKYYAYNLKNQGFGFLCMFTEKVKDNGIFSSILIEGLKGEADRNDKIIKQGNGDSIVTFFEIINYVNQEYGNKKLLLEGTPNNIIKYLVYGSGDIVLTIGSNQ